MAEILLTQAEADALIAMEKIRTDNNSGTTRGPASNFPFR